MNDWKKEFKKKVASLEKENAAQAKKIAELERRLGISGAEPAKPKTRLGRARNSAKPRASANTWA